MASAVVLVPPFLKLAYGPLLGPAMLAGAGHRAGHDVRVLDLNAVWIRERLPSWTFHEPRRFVGDHDRPPALTELHRDFKRELGLVAPRETHEAMLAAAHRLAGTSFGAWITKQLLTISAAPAVLGISVMYSDQVEPALAITIVARRLWPHALIVWGGAHVTALREEIAIDDRNGGNGLIDGFVFGYAERTWVDLLDAVGNGTAPPSEVTSAGSGNWRPALDDGSVVPIFDDCSLYEPTRLTLPSQCSRGCIYGQCLFCTYPSIEGRPRALPIEPARSVIEQAIRCSAAVSFKDSLMAVERLDVMAELIGGRVPWSACTKLNSQLDVDRLKRLVAGGLATLEIGLETLDPAAQAAIWKKQPESMFMRFIDAADAAGIAVVVNYMTGLPGADGVEQERYKKIVNNELTRRSNLVSKLEHNEFQLERLSPMGLAPARYGIRVIEALPWSSVLKWVAAVPALVQLKRRRA